MENAPKRCLLCGGEDRQPLFDKDSWRVYKCGACGLGFLDPRPSKQDLDDLYSREYCEAHFVEGGAPGSPEFKKRLSLESHRIRFFNGMKKKGRVLDMGCGYGYFLAACRERGYEVQGLDVSGFAVQHATDRLGIPVAVGELDEVQLPLESFDVITMWHFLEHTSDPKASLLKAMGWLKRDGVLVVDVPNHEGTDALKTWADWVGWSLPYHLFHFTPRTLTQILGLCGLNVVKTKDYHSETVKANLKRFPVLGLFARLIAKQYSGHSVAMLARLENGKQ